MLCSQCGGRRRVTWIRGPYGCTHRSEVSVPGIQRLGQFPMEEKSGKEERAPQKPLDWKEVTGFGLGMRGSKGRQPRMRARSLRRGAVLGRGKSPFVPLFQPPAHHPARSLPPSRPVAPPGGYGTGCRGKWCVRVVVSLKPCSYGAAPHRDQRALGSATPPSFPMWRLQGTSKGQNTDMKPAGWRGKSHCQHHPPSSSHPRSVHTGITAPLLGKGWIPVHLSLCNRQGLSWSPATDPVLRCPTLCLYAFLQHSSSGFIQGML